jgi:hypothetical protein
VIKIKSWLNKIYPVKFGYLLISFYFGYLKSRICLFQQINNILDGSSTGQACVVCKNKKTLTVKLVHAGDENQKYLCLACQHLFSLWLKSNFKKVEKLFDYNTETIRKEEQKYLLRKLRSVLGKDGTFLDFGVGGNINASKELAKDFPHSLFYACDLNKRKEENYFTTYSDKSYIGKFDGIATNSVIEHIDNTIEAWKYFNNLLKPVTRKERGGIMAHSFPSLIHYDLSHWGVKIKSHVCLISKKSLNTILTMSGFKLLGWKYSNKLRWPIFYFQKVKNI